MLIGLDILSAFLFKFIFIEFEYLVNVTKIIKYIENIVKTK